MKVVLDMNLDGYESKEEEIEAIKVFLEDMDFSASYIKVVSIDGTIYTDDVEFTDVW
jgi:hypothetical protein